MNKLFISGRLTSEPKFFPERVGKDAMVGFSIANNKKIDNKEYTLYLYCQIYGSNAAKASRDLYKGVKILVEGTLLGTSDDFGNKGMKLLVTNWEIMEHTKAYIEQYGVKTSNKSLDKELEDDGFMAFDPNEKLPWEL